MSGGIKIGFKNAYYSKDGKRYTPIKTSKPVFLSFKEAEPMNNKSNFDLTQTIGITQTISKKDNPGLFEFIRIQRRQGIFANYIYRRFGKIVYREE